MSPQSRFANSVGSICDEPRDEYVLEYSFANVFRVKLKPNMELENKIFPNSGLRRLALI